MKTTSSVAASSKVHGRLRLRRTAAAGVLALSVFGLAGCGMAGSPGVAATTNGQPVSEKQVDDVMADLEKVGATGQIQRGTVVAMLAMRPVILQAGEADGSAVGEDMVRGALQQQIPDVSEATVQFQQAQATGAQLGPEALPAFEQGMKDANIEVNPRYGDFDPNAGFTPSAPNWLAPAAGMPPGHP